MNKQQSKESLRDKVKGMLGLGPARPPSKQSETRPSEFIITTDIIKVCGRDEHLCMFVHTQAHPVWVPHHALCHGLYLSHWCFSGAPTRLRSEQPRPHDEPRLWSCQNKKIWGSESATVVTYLLLTALSITFCATHNLCVCVCTPTCFFRMQWRLYGKLWRTCWLQSSPRMPDRQSCSCWGPLYTDRYRDTIRTRENLNCDYTSCHFTTSCSLFCFEGWAARAFESLLFQPDQRLSTAQRGPLW